MQSLGSFPLTCWLCQNRALRVYRLSDAIDNEVLQAVQLWIAGGSSDHVLCSRCNKDVKIRVKRAMRFHTTDAGKQLLHTAEAFYARDKSRLCALYAGNDDMATEPSARDVRHSLGRVHPHVLFQQTSMWEPYAGITADNARSVAVNSFSRREWRMARLLMVARSGVA